LDEAQERAVRTTEGPVLILAGPGSGKTRVITHRMAHLIADKKVAPENILAITFTNKAAKGMEERVKGMLGDGPSPWISTFHSTGARILRRHIRRLGYTEDYAIYNDDDKVSLIKEILSSASPSKFNSNDVLQRISQAKNDLVDADSIRMVAALTDNDEDAKFGKVFALYEEALKKNNALDFDDLITLPTKLFREHPDILLKYQNLWRYIIVDEYQDTNKAQYAFVNTLVAKYRNICVVGDSDQSIYGWRGADIKNILSFRDDYRDAEVIVLGRNYRSTRNIVKAAQRLIEWNAQRDAKSIWTLNEPGDPVQVASVYNDLEEAGFVAEEVSRLHREGMPLKDMAVFYRTSGQSRQIEEALLGRGIPYVTVGTTSFYDRKEVKDIVAYLRVIANPSDSVSLKRIINTPHRGIGRKTVEKIEALAAKKGIPLHRAIEAALPVFSKGTRLKLEKFLLLLNNLSTIEVNDHRTGGSHHVAGIVRRVITDTDYTQSIVYLTPEDSKARVSNVEAVVTAAAEFDAAGGGTLTGFLEHIALVSGDGHGKQRDAVSLLTLHASKGLEFPVVFMVGVEENFLPHKKSIESGDVGDIEEERRLCYVGITRAKKRLYIVNASERIIWGKTVPCTPSRFIEEMQHKRHG
jgi:DNA helicase-2/ATP-dependent DNA helicase PcrA